MAPILGPGPLSLLSALKRIKLGPHPYSNRIALLNLGLLTLNFGKKGSVSSGRAG